MTAELARVGGAIGCVGLALLLVATRRFARIAGLVFWAAGAAVLAAYLAPHGHRPLLAALAVAGLFAAAAGAWLFRRWPWLLPVATLACVPARIPVHVGATKANLLVPLYAVVGAAAFLLAWQLARGDARARELGPLAWPLGLFVAWTGVSFAWTGDVREGAIAVTFFYLPFGLLALALARLPWHGRVLEGLYLQLAAMALVFAAVGVYQYAGRDVFWNPKVIVDNAYAPSGYFFRVNSVFYDPSMYGRFLVVAILASLVVVLRRPLRLLLWAAVGVIALTWIGLLFSFSQSSFAALIVGVLLAAAIVWRWRAAAAVALVGVVLVSVGMAAPPVRHTVLGKSSTSFNHATSDRLSLITHGLRIAFSHPAAGVGTGSFKRAYAERTGLRGKDPKAAASHDTPITVAAELGVPGLALYVWLVASALGLAFRRRGNAAALAVGLTLAAVTVHSLSYNAFFEDPLTWGLFALVAVLAAQVSTEQKFRLS